MHIDYRYSPELTITANGYEDCIERTVNSISIDKEKLYAKMATNNKTTESFQIILSFNDNVTDSRYKTFVLKTVEISR